MLVHDDWSHLALNVIIQCIFAALLEFNQVNPSAYRYFTTENYKVKFTGSVSSSCRLFLGGYFWSIRGCLSSSRFGGRSISWRIFFTSLECCGFNAGKYSSTANGN